MQLLSDLGLRIVGTPSKGRDWRFTLAVISGAESHLYAVLRETAEGEIAGGCQTDDA